MQIEVHIAAIEEARLVAEMAVALTEEISQRLDAKHFDLSVEKTTELCTSLISGEMYVALLASRNEKPVGFVGISEGQALYAEGAFGTMQEFYVVPTARSEGVGTALIEAAMQVAFQRGWRRLEVCTPPLPEFSNSLAFYERNGFEVTGGRKLKRLAQRH
jgi:GNAT superfamily N-acetyltransferase